MKAPVQQPLPNISLSDTATFDNFVGATEVVTYLRAQAEGGNRDLAMVYVWGERFTGRSHLLQAACAEVQGKDRHAIYLPLAQRSQIDTRILQQSTAATQVCFDDIEMIADDRAWEEAMFHFLNDARDHGTRVLLAAAVPPLGLKLSLADLQSRLAAAMILRIVPLSDREKEEALRKRAKNRGLVLTDEVISFIMARTYRDMGSLLAIVEELDRETLTQQRKVTIPFVKQVLRL